MVRKFVALLLAPALLAGVAAGLTRASASDDPNAASFVAKTNAERQSRGLRPYAVASDLAAVAKRHSADMAARQSLYHNPNLGSEVTGWQVVGENVGDGGSVDGIHTAFMDSPDHRANILATDYTQVGIGTVTDGNGVIWVTEVFRLPSQAPTVSAPTTTRAARSVSRTPARPAVRPAPAKPAVKATRKSVSAVVRPETDAFVAALVPDSALVAPGDPFTMVLTYVDTMAALRG